MTSEPTDPRAARKLVRMYSLEAAERLPQDNDAHFLAQVLKESVPESARNIISPWRRFFDPSPDERPKPDELTKVIALESDKLREKWLVFQKGCSKEDQLDLDEFEPSIESVVDLIGDLGSSIQAKRKATVAGKITKGFHIFCEKLDAHRTFLEMIPEGSEYVSIFSGALNVIIKASVNHGRVAEDLADALCAISENVAEIRIDIDMFPSRELIEKVADLYAHIFIFLSSYMDHLMRKRTTRFLDSFNENASRKFDPDIKRINDKSASIRYLVQQSHRAEGRDTRLTVEDTKSTVDQIARDIRIGQEGDERRYAELRDYATRMERELRFARSERRELREGGRQLAALTAKVANLLEEHALGPQSSRPGLGYLTPSQASSRGTSPIGHLSGYQYSAEDVSLSSAHLEDIFHRDRVRLLCEDFGPASAPPNVLRRIMEWTLGKTVSRILWLDGPPTEADDHENPLTVLAATIVTFAAQSKVPVFSYFCELRRGEKRRGGNSREMQGLTTLMASLLRQMVEHLLPAFDTDIDLSSKRWKSIDGTEDSWDMALALFKDLVRLMPAKMVCVVDGLHWIDDRRTEPYLKQLVEALKSTKFNVLLTSSGRVASLRQCVADEDTLVVENFHLKSDEELHPMVE